VEVTNIGKHYLISITGLSTVSDLSSVGSILRQSRFRRDPRQMDEDEEMWFNEDEDDYDSNAETKVKDCYVALKACPAQNGPADKKAASEDAEKKKSGSGAAAANTSEAKSVVKTVNYWRDFILVPVFKIEYLRS
jgi:hypothetical protein